MWDKKNINSKEIDKVMDTKVEIERQVKERNINKFIKKERLRSLKSPITKNRYKRRNEISWK
jgi:hypothetical protein